MKLTRISLIVLHLFAALNAFAGGYYGLSGAQGMDPKLLAGSPFHSYFIPSLFLAVIIGGGMAVAGIAWIRRGRPAARMSLAMGALLVVWIVIQVAIIGPISWMQPVSFAVGVGMAGLALLAMRGERQAHEQVAV